MKFNYIRIWLILLLFPCLIGSFVYGNEPVGKRPYEMDWANRLTDDNPPLIDFENFGQWKIEEENAQGEFVITREQQMFGEYVAKLTYREAGTLPVVSIRPENPIPLVDLNFDAMSLWVYGNNWAWIDDPTTPRIGLQILFLLPNGEETAVTLDIVRWEEWYLCHKRFDAQQLNQLQQNGVAFDGFRIVNGTNSEDRIIYLDNFALFKEKFQPLVFTGRPRRGVEMFPGQGVGQNTGEGQLPFPNREETILPDSAAEGSVNTLQEKEGCFIFTYTGSDGKLTLCYTPQSGTWSDLQAQWNDSHWFNPCEEGGINKLATADNEFREVTNRKLIEAKCEGNLLITRWLLDAGDISAEAQYRMQLMGKSLVLDTICLGGNVVAVDFGQISSIEKPFQQAVPYYSYNGTNRPKVVVFQLSGTTETLFFLGNIDWYRSESSDVTGAAESGSDFSTTNGKTIYLPKTDRKRNDVYERFFLTISPDFAEVLPSIPNPTSPWKHVTGKGVWKAHAAGDRELDKKYWHNVWRHGMRHVIITDHETGWRDGGESFTFRTEPAPGKGGNEGQYDYARYMQDTLGFVYGPYNNFTDFAPVNGFWNDDMVSRTVDNQLQEAWPRCYASKPTRAVEYCETLTPIIQNKFNFSTAYCDVHTAVPPWTRTDYDYRIPGAGTFSAVFYPYGEIMLLQKMNWRGPVYSEGAYHCYYSGLTDGNYAQDRGYDFPGGGWLVDFDLIKMHPLECNFGMGDPSMYDPAFYDRKLTGGKWISYLDRYLAATIAFGHPGYLANNIGNAGGMISYFMVQQIASRYTQVNVKSIRYRDDLSRDCTTSQALADRTIFERNQPVIKYEDGTDVYVNGNTEAFMEVEVTLPRRNEATGNIEPKQCQIAIPPNGYLALSGDRSVVVEALNQNGSRYDYCDSPEYIFLNGRGTFQKLPKAAGAAMGVCLIDATGDYEIIIPSNQEMGFAIDADSAVAFDLDGNELGAASIRRAAGLLYVTPVSGAFSYKLKREIAKQNDLFSERFEVVPGEKVSCRSRTNPELRWECEIPATMESGKLFWFEPLPETSINFLTMPVVSSDIRLKNDQLILALNCNLVDNPAPKITATIGDKPLAPQKLSPNHDSSFGDWTKHYSHIYSIQLPQAEKEETLPVVILVESGEYRQTITKKLITDLGYRPYSLELLEGKVTSLPLAKWVQLRGNRPSMDLPPTLAHVYQHQAMNCGGEMKPGYFIHPPYQGGTGRVYLEYDLELPAESAKQPLSVRTMVGKQNGSDLGDGILFQIAVVESQKEEVILASQHLTTHTWLPLEASLEDYQGKTIKLRLISDVGPVDNANGDWSCWGELQLESRDQLLQRSLE